MANSEYKPTTLKNIYIHIYNEKGKIFLVTGLLSIIVFIRYKTQYKW